MRRGWHDASGDGQSASCQRAGFPGKRLAVLRRLPSRGSPATQRPASTSPRTAVGASPVRQVALATPCSPPQRKRPAWPRPCPHGAGCGSRRGPGGIVSLCCSQGGIKVCSRPLWGPISAGYQGIIGGRAAKRQFTPRTFNLFSSGSVRAPRPTNQNHIPKWSRRRLHLQLEQRYPESAESFHICSSEEGSSELGQSHHGLHRSYSCRTLPGDSPSEMLEAVGRRCHRGRGRSPAAAAAAPAA